eukprot:10072363-Alexandrium_andersonii.AAC.1
MELPCGVERHHSVPAPGEPSRATVLMTTAGPQGQVGYPWMTTPSAKGQCFRLGSRACTVCPAFSRRPVSALLVRRPGPE